MAYLDAAADRREERAEARFMTIVEAVRAGEIFAHDGAAHTRWQSRRARRSTSRPDSLEGLGLEQAVFSLARSHPEYVVVEG